MKKFIILITILPFGLFSVTPGRWSHLDQYVIGGSKFGPYKELVKSEKNEIIYSAQYYYNDEGYLIKEVYMDEKGKKDGETIIKYENAKVTTEELYNGNNELKEIKKFYYDANGKMKEIELLSPNKKQILKCKINSIEKGLITGAEINWTESKTSESFSVSKDQKNEGVLIQEMFDDNKKLSGHIKYFFNKDGKLERRENIQPLSEKMNLFEYKDGVLSGYSFHVKQEGKWIRQKTHLLFYKSTNKLSN